MKTNQPIISVKFKNESFKVLEILGKSGDKLNAHKVDNDALLQLLSGSVSYKEGNKITKITNEELQPIPKGQLHELEFEKESRMLLFLVSNTKMQFSKL